MTSFSTMPTPPLSDHHQAPHQSFKDASAADPSSGGVAANAGRKRRAELQPIDLRTCAKSKLISLSSESLNSGNADSDGLQSPSGGENCPGSSTDSEGEEHLKRLCLRSSQSTSPVDFSGLPTIGHRLSPTTVTDEVLPNLAELEGSANNSGGFSSSSTSSRGQLSSGGLLLEDRLLGGHFELVGDGRNCKAVHSSQPESLYHCQIVKLEEFQQVAEIMARMQRVASSYSAEQFALRSNLLLPLDQLRVLRSDQRKELVYLLLPDHHGTLHQLLEENELSDGGGPARLEEGRVQPILKQVALVVEFCHRIGLYFRDFRLRKFVFVDSEKTRIRVNNVLDLYLASEMGCDSVVSREFIPAYVAPEVLDKKNDVYGGAAADIWALGVLMFTLLNGRYPFFEASPSPVALLRRIRAHRFSFPIRASISEPTRWLIHALLCHSPGDRPSAAQLLQAHWFREEGGTAERGGHAETAKDSGPWDRQQQPKTISPPLFLFGRSPSTTPPMALGRASPTATATTAAQVPSRSQQLQQQHTISNSQSSWGGRGRHPAALEHLTAAGLPLPAGRQQQHQRTASESRQPIAGRPPAFVPIRARDGGIGRNFDLAAEGRLTAFRPTSAANGRIHCAGNERGKAAERQQTDSSFMAGKQMTKEASEDQVVPDVANNKCHRWC